MWKAIVLIAAAVGVATSPPARADYPDRAIRLVVPYPAGAGTDSSARIVADALSRRLGQQIVVDNRPGASGTIGVDYVAKSAPDGYTLLWTSIDSITLVPALKGPKLPYRVPEDLAFIGKFCETGMALVASSKLPVSDLGEFIAYAKANPGKVNYGTSGVGGAPHLGTLLLAKYSDIKLTHVPYKGIAPAMAAMLGGETELTFPAVLSGMAHFKSGRLRPLAIAGKSRYPALHDVPTAAEAGLAGFEIDYWYGLFGPAGLPAPIVQQIQRDVAATMTTPEMKESLLAQGSVAIASGPEELDKRVRDELALWTRVVKAGNVKVE